MSHRQGKKLRQGEKLRPGKKRRMRDSPWSGKAAPYPEKPEMERIKNAHKYWLSRVCIYNKVSDYPYPENPDMDEFDRIFDEKDVLLDKLESLDEGFEELYKRVSEQLKANRSQYATQIKSLQEKISRITELSASIQAQEARNKKMIDEYFAKERQGIKQNRVSSKAAFDYYRNMSGMNIQSSGMWDSKN